MFFNNCNWCSRCKPYCKCDKRDNKEKNPCDMKDKCDYDKYDKRNYDNNDNCDYGKQDRCCCRVRYENHTQYSNCKKFDNDYCKDERKDFDKQNSYNNYNNFDYNTEKYYDEKENFTSYNNDNYYAPNWENDRDCKRDNNNQHDRNGNKFCCPVKFVCFPWDKY